MWAILQSRAFEIFTCLDFVFGVSTGYHAVRLADLRQDRSTGSAVCTLARPTAHSIVAFLVFDDGLVRTRRIIDHAPVQAEGVHQFRRQYLKKRGIEPFLGRAI